MSLFDIDAEARHKPRRRPQYRRLLLPLVAVAAIVTLLGFYFVTHQRHVPVDVLALADKSAPSDPVTDAVLENNNKAAAAAAAAIQYTTDDKGRATSRVTGVKNTEKVTAQKMELDKTLEKPEKETQAVTKSTRKRPLRFNAAAEFKAIVALSPVVVFTWDTSAAIPLREEKEGYVESTGLLALLRSMLKTLGENYQITPVPTYVSLDKHPHFRELAVYVNLLYHKLNDKDGVAGKEKSKSRAESLDGEEGEYIKRGEPEKRVEEPTEKKGAKNIYGLPPLKENENVLPGIVIAGKPIGNARQLKEAHQKGTLLGVFKELGDGIVNIERVG